ncbi:baseplate J/gp47 family protein [Chloroflexota bacterium]
MKTYILHLDQHDDIISARDKMGWGKSGRILLVWPESGRVLNRRLDLLLLQRYSVTLGAQIAIVSRDPEVRYHAPRLGIPIFKSLRRAQSTAWRIPRRFRKNFEEESSDMPAEAAPPADPAPHRGILPERPPPARPALNTLTRLLTFTVGVLAFLAIAALLLPGAELTLHPEVRTQEIEIRLKAHPDYEFVDINGKVPAQWTKIIVEGRDSIPASGIISLPDRPATGEARFTNLTDQAVDIPAGTVIHSLDDPPIRFEVSEAGRAASGPGQNVSLPVRCLQPGTIGNLGANKLVALEGQLGTQVNVTNPRPMYGGRQRQEPAPSQEDRDQLIARLGAALRQTATQEIQQGLAEGDLWWPFSLNLREALEQEFMPAGQEPADILELSMRLEFEALVISAANIQELANLVLDSNLPSGFTPLDEQIKIEATTPNPSTPNIRWDLHVSRQIRASLSEPQVIQLSMGPSGSGAAAQFGPANHTDPRLVAAPAGSAFPFHNPRNRSRVNNPAQGPKN